MVEQQNTVVVGIFEQPTQAKKTVDELRRAGYRDDEIDFLARDEMPETTEEKNVNVTTSAIGGALGILVGAVGASFMPGLGQYLAFAIILTALGLAIVGTLIGNILGTLTQTGLSVSRYYQREREKGRSIVLVKWPADYERIHKIMQRNGALRCQYLVG